MSISGTVPNFDVSPFAQPAQSSATVVTVTGAADDARADGAVSTEDLRAFYVRAAGLLSCSGVLGTGAEAGLQCISGSILSGIRNLQRELAFRIADLDGPGEANAARLGRAQAALTVAGEVQFGA